MKGPPGMTGIVTLTPIQRGIARHVDALDLGPVQYTLIQPEPGETTLTAVQAIRYACWYRCFLCLHAWHRDDTLIPCAAIDRVWRAHITDTRRYHHDTLTALGYIVPRQPYSPPDIDGDHPAYARTRHLFRDYFRIDLPAGDPAHAFVTTAVPIPA
jgi:hypothetical protein